MNQKAKRKKAKRKAEAYKKVRQDPGGSSWGAAVVSFLKEYFLNPGKSTLHYDYDDELSQEGKRKKNLIWGPLILSSGVVITLLPILRWEVVAEESWPVRIFTTLVVVAAGIGMGISGFLIIKNSLKSKDKQKDLQ